MRTEQQTEPEKNAAAFSEPPPRRASRGWWLVLLAVVALAALVIFAILPRIQARATLKTETAEMAIPTVNVAHPRHTAPAEEVVLPASVQAYIDAPIYARTNGYLKRWTVDIGTHVKA